MPKLLTAEDHERIAAAIRRAESLTDAEIVCVVASRASDWRFVPAVYAGALALLAPWPLVFLTQWSVQAILLAQLVTFAAMALLLSWPPLRDRMVPRVLARQRARQAAAEQFLVRGLGRTQGRTGILVYVAVAERFACVIPDSAAEDALPAELWRTAVERLTDGLKAGRAADGFEAAISVCIDALAVVRPASPVDENELPDRVIEL